MTPSEIEAVLQAAYRECAALGEPLNAQQQEILFRTLVNRLVSQPQGIPEPPPSPPELEVAPNPLDELTPAERQALLQFIQEQQRQNQNWKAQLLNDWLLDRSSGSIQFIRESYGLPWLERVLPEHIAQYADDVLTTLKAGDRIEVSNGLWEWVQDEGPCSREWFPCTVIRVTETTDRLSIPTFGYDHCTNCTIRFDNGMEYEIQGIYQWNRYNWRWAKS